jgi:hypothetical protein
MDLLYNTLNQFPNWTKNYAQPAIQKFLNGI